MIKQIYFHALIIFATLLGVACSAQNKVAPVDQLIEGPFDITSSWQRIDFKKPLKTIPHVQSLNILLDTKKYKHVKAGVKNSNYSIMLDRYQSLIDGQNVEPEIILIDKIGREFKPLHTSIGVRYTSLGDYFFLGFGLSTRKGFFYYPKDVEFVAIKIRANTSVKVEHLYWIASRYYQAPNDTWNDVDPKKIIDIKALF